MEKGLEKLLKAEEKAKEVIFGQDELISRIFMALVSEGHLLIEGLPGLGKTLSVKTVGEVCQLTHKRIQFTPDLLPSDLIGTMVYSPSKDQFSTKFGPIFTQLLLADEINRSPAKVQSALLEAMGEYQVTIGEETHRLTHPFCVLATQNPIDHEGTYPLPQAQLDRFMMKVYVGYPEKEDEKRILSLKDDPTKDLESVITTDELLKVKEEVSGVYVDDKILDLILHIIQCTRPDSKDFMKNYKGAIVHGASPRGTQWLTKTAKFLAYKAGKDFVSPEEIIQVAPQVLGHRIILSYEAKVDGLKSDNLIQEIVSKVV